MLRCQERNLNQNEVLKENMLKEVKEYLEYFAFPQTKYVQLRQKTKWIESFLVPIHCKIDLTN